jgi:hypothetical protein
MSGVKMGDDEEAASTKEAAGPPPPPPVALWDTHAATLAPLIGAAVLEQTNLHQHALETLRASSSAFRTLAQACLSHFPVTHLFELEKGQVRASSNFHPAFLRWLLPNIIKG